MLAPGNRDRFKAAELISYVDHQIDLVDDWRTAFSRLQPISKETVRRNPGQFLASVDDIVYRGSTSATRGQYFVYFADSEWNRVRLQARRSSLNWWGISESTPIINVGSRLLPVRQGDMAMAGLLTSDFIDRFLYQLSTTPAVIRGYPSRLCDVATTLVGKDLPVVLGVICTGEPLFDFQKALLEKVFGVPVINEYGCQESGISGLSCPEAGRLHLDSDRCLYEVVDGQLVSTDLFNVVMPMVRYQCGDIVRLNFDPCPCGRSGPTAVLRGRVEDIIQTQNGSQYLGDVGMPELRGVLHYQALRSKEMQIKLQVCPDPMQQQLDFQPLMDWAQDVFGDIDVQISIHQTAVPSSPPSRICDDKTWIERITKGSWSTELSEPHIPDGEGHKAAQLLHELINPAVMMYQGLSLSTWTLLQEVSQSTFTDDRVNELAARISLLACCFLWNDSSTEQIYSKAIQRLKPTLEIQPGHPTNIDRLIATLFLNTKTGLNIWAEWLHDVSNNCSGSTYWQVDTFTLQHTLQALESAVQRGWQAPSHFFLTLRPFVSVLIGDLSFFAPNFAPWILAYWFELLHQQPLPESKWLTPSDSNGFEQAWLRWRQQLTKNPQEASLWELSMAARSPEEQERVALERGYALLIQGQRLDPEDWIGELQSIGESRSLSEQTFDVIPWQPILKALVKPLFEQGKHALAYDCLRAVTVPSSRISAFERFASQCNYKRYVLCDLSSSVNE